MTRETAVCVTKRIRATPERLFQAWTDPRQLMRWWHLEGPGWAFGAADVDLRVGGRYRLAMTGPDGAEHATRGVYRDVRPPTLLSFTWDWENPAHSVGETIVTVRMTDLGDGTTELVLTHERFADQARLAGHDSGWNQLFRILDSYITGTAP